MVLFMQTNCSTFLRHMEFYPTIKKKKRKRDAPIGGNVWDLMRSVIPILLLWHYEKRILQTLIVPWTAAVDRTRP